MCFIINHWAVQAKWNYVEWQYKASWMFAKVVHCVLKFSTPVKVWNPKAEYCLSSFPPSLCLIHCRQGRESIILCLPASEFWHYIFPSCNLIENCVFIKFTSIVNHGKPMKKAILTDSGRKHKDAETNTRMKPEKDKKANITGGRDRMRHQPLLGGKHWNNLTRSGGS